MIKYVVCDLFESPAHVLVNTVNTVGVMGKGIASDFKRIYPEMFRQYQILCERQAFDVGQLWLFRTENKWILNFPTKKHWRKPSHPDYIEAGLEKFVSSYHMFGITSISFPMLGCGNGELDWETQVRPTMEQYLRPLPITAFIHLQHRTDPFSPEHRNIEAFKSILRREPESLSFAEVLDDLRIQLRVQGDYKTISTETPFRASIDESNEGIRVDVGGDTVALSQDALLDLWQQLRQSGFLAPDSMPPDIHPAVEQTVALFATLPYVKPVLMADPNRGIRGQAIGLRLAARPSPDGPLFTRVQAVQPV